MKWFVKSFKCFMKSLDPLHFHYKSFSKSLFKWFSCYCSDYWREILCFCSDLQISQEWLMRILEWSLYNCCDSQLREWTTKWLMRTLEWSFLYNCGGSQLCEWTIIFLEWSADIRSDFLREWGESHQTDFGVAGVNYWIICVIFHAIWVIYKVVICFTKLLLRFAVLFEYFLKLLEYVILYVIGVIYKVIGVNFYVTVEICKGDGLTFYHWKDFSCYCTDSSSYGLSLYQFTSSFLFSTLKVRWKWLGSSNILLTPEMCNWSKVKNHWTNFLCHCSSECVFHIIGERGTKSLESLSSIYIASAYQEWLSPQCFPHIWSMSLEWDETTLNWFFCVSGVSYK